MDFWSSLEHKMKYKYNGEIDKKTSKEWVNCAKIINKLDNKMAILGRFLIIHRYQIKVIMKFSIIITF